MIVPRRTRARKVPPPPAPPPPQAASPARDVYDPQADPDPFAWLEAPRPAPVPKRGPVCPPRAPCELPPLTWADLCRETGERRITLEHAGAEFVLTHRLGQGAAGCVVRAVREGGDERACAIKVIHKAAAAARCRIPRDYIVREMHTMRAVAERAGAERHLVPLLMSWEEPERVYFVMVRPPVVFGHTRG